MQKNFDVAVIGAGPAGCVAAAAHARGGASVLLVEANPRAANRFAGEWVHPPGLAVLERLDMVPTRSTVGHGAARGFAVFPDDGSPAVRLPYADAELGITCEHHSLVEELRERVIAVPGVNYLPFARVKGIGDRRLQIAQRDKSEVEVFAGRIVGAEGRNSLVRQHLELPENSSLLSYMAGIDLVDVDLPWEGYGHVLLGAPGPILLYRTDARTVRLCIDLPLRYSYLRRETARIWETFSPIFPTAGLRKAFRHALANTKISWAATRFRPRTFYGAGHIALVGDAVGHFHPLTATGMTIGFLDGESLASNRDVGRYQAQREAGTFISELLSSALYQVITYDEQSAAGLRRAVFETWRNSAAQRERTMRILAGSAGTPRTFGHAFVNVAIEALKSTAQETATQAAWTRFARRTVAYLPWAQWPLASVLPQAVRAASRAHSTADDPVRGLKFWRAWASHRKEPTEETTQVRQTLPAPLDLQRVAHVLSELTPTGVSGELTRELEDTFIALHAEYAEAGEAPIVAAAKQPVVGILQEESLDDFRFERETTLSNRVFATAMQYDRYRQQEPTAEAHAGLLEELRSSLRKLLAAASWLQPERSAARKLWSEQQAEAFELARALRAVRLALPGLCSREVETFRRRRIAELRARQLETGGWASHGGGGLSPYATAMSILTLRRLGVAPTDPDIRRGLSQLIRKQDLKGKWVEEGGQGDSPHRRAETVTARATQALIECRTLSIDAVERACAYILQQLEAAIAARASSPDRLSAAEPAASCATTACLALYYQSRVMRDLACAKPATDQATRRSKTTLEEDNRFCWQALEGVSRTFVRPIEMLDQPLRQAVMCGYLLCRVVDTVEDLPELPLSQREAMYASFLRLLDDSAEESRFAGFFASLDASRCDVALCQRIDRVMRVFRSLPDTYQQAVTPWVSEMARGMALYSRRPVQNTGVHALFHLTDLERYCYYVAGTVGHMLTELFVAALPELSDAKRAVMRSQAEAFGLGLQLVNILKDVTDDLERGWSFVPAALCEAQGIRNDQLTDPAAREAAHRAVAPIFARAEEHLANAFRYCLALPPEETSIRLFCLLPLWMARRTLVLARGNDAMFVPGQAVKISRDEVESLIARCVEQAHDDSALKEAFAQLGQAQEPKPAVNGAAVAW